LAFFFPLESKESELLLSGYPATEVPMLLLLAPRGTAHFFVRGGADFFGALIEDELPRDKLDVRSKALADELPRDKLDVRSEALADELPRDRLDALGSDDIASSALALV